MNSIVSVSIFLIAFVSVVGSAQPVFVPLKPSTPSVCQQYTGIYYGDRSDGFAVLIDGAGTRHPLVDSAYGDEGCAVAEAYFEDTKAYGNGAVVSVSAFLNSQDELDIDCTSKF